MFSRRALVVFGIVVAEVLAFDLVVDRIGWATTVVATLALMVLGVSVGRYFLGALARSGVSPAVADGSDRPVGSVAGAVAGIIAGLLLIVPGFVTGVLGALLLVPPVRHVVVNRARRRLEPLAASRIQFYDLSGRPARRHDVVDVDVINEDTPSSASGELG